MFPSLPKQSGYNKRLRTAYPLVCKTILALAASCPSWFDDLWITDATPVPCGMSTETVKLLGLKRYLVCTGDGMPIMCLADPKIGEREVLAALRQQPSSHP
jgi:hypothetical protein